MVPDRARTHRHAAPSARRTGADRIPSEPARRPVRICAEIVTRGIGALFSTVARWYLSLELWPRTKIMKKTKMEFLVLLSAAAILGGCVSSNPRPYAPIAQPPPNDQVVFEGDFSACASAVAAGERNFGSSGSAVAVGAVGTVVTVQVLGGAASATAVGGSATLAATGVGLIIAVPMATYALSSSRRARNEREVQSAMTECLAQRGHTIVSWTRISRGGAATLMATPTRRTRTR